MRRSRCLFALHGLQSQCTLPSEPWWLFPTGEKSINGFQVLQVEHSFSCIPIRVRSFIWVFDFSIFGLYPHLHPLRFCLYAYYQVLGIAVSLVKLLKVLNREEV